MKNKIKNKLISGILIVGALAVSGVVNHLKNSDTDRQSIQIEDTVSNNTNEQEIKRTTNNTINNWLDNLKIAQENNIDFILPKDIKDYYVRNNYAILLNELQQNDKIASFKKELFKNDKWKINMDDYYNAKDKEFYGKNLLTLLGDTSNNEAINNKSPELYLADIKENDIDKFLDNVPEYINNDSQYQVTALLTYKGFMDSKNHRGKFKDDPLGWPSKNIKLENHPLTPDKTYSGYLWNRSHLIADRFNGKAIPENATTGTRTQNVGDNTTEGGGMVFVENAVAEFYSQNKEPFINIYKKTGFVPLIQVNINYYPDCSNFNDSYINIANAYTVQLKFYKLGVTDSNQYLSKYCNLNDLSLENQKYIKSRLDFVYSDKYNKRNNFYDQLFNNENGATVIIPNIINDLEFDYKVESERLPIESTKIYKSK